MNISWQYSHFIFSLLTYYFKCYIFSFFFIYLDWKIYFFSYSIIKIAEFIVNFTFIILHCQVKILYIFLWAEFAFELFRSCCMVFCIKCRVLRFGPGFVFAIFRELSQMRLNGFVCFRNAAVRKNEICTCSRCYHFAELRLMGGQSIFATVRVVSAYAKIFIHRCLLLLIIQFLFQIRNWFYIWIFDHI